MRLLAVVSKLTGVSTTVESSAVTLNAPSIVKLSVAREEISQLTRINQDLVVTLHSGETITIKNFTLPTIWAQASWYWRKMMARYGG